MYLEIFLADFAVFRVFLGISRDFAEIPEFCGSATAQNIRSPALETYLIKVTKSILWRQINEEIKACPVNKRHIFLIY